ncbi:MAG: hypothetical protein GY832_27360 [Chloroflexi bacterium]|nr:hypothetical protein [Chloroflexota bacterium]
MSIHIGADQGPIASSIPLARDPTRAKCVVDWNVRDTRASTKNGDIALATSSSINSFIDKLCFNGMGYVPDSTNYYIQF